MSMLTDLAHTIPKAWQRQANAWMGLDPDHVHDWLADAGLCPCEACEHDEDDPAR